MVQKLSGNWFIEGRIDFEYKKYILLAYLQYVDNSFVRSKLYPHLGDLIKHYRALKGFMDSKQEFSERLPKRLKLIDLGNFLLEYDKIISDDDLMNEIENIVLFSIDQLGSKIREGKEMYEFIEEQVKFWPLGLVSGRSSSEGIILIRNGEIKEINAFKFSSADFQKSQTRFYSIKLKFLRNYTLSLVNTYENVKHEILKSFRDMNIGSAFVLESGFTLPLRPTLLPISKRKLLQEIATKK